MNKEQSVYLALGSNLGDRVDYLRRAITALLRRPRLRVKAVSPVYETKPIGLLDQPDYLNMVVQIETTFSPLELLAVTQQIERELHRTRDVRWGPRTLDIDILIYGEDVLKRPQLTIPHPRMHERAFVLLPLNDLAPDLIVPSSGRTVTQLVEQVSGKEGVLLCPTISLAAEFGLTEN